MKIDFPFLAQETSPSAKDMSFPFLTSPVHYDDCGGYDVDYDRGSTVQSSVMEASIAEPQVIVSSNNTLQNEPRVVDSNTISPLGHVDNVGSVEDTTENMGRCCRLRKPSSRLKDYITNTVRRLDPVTPTAYPASIKSSGTPFHIACFVNCDKFSARHNHLLAAITAGAEPTSFPEAVKDPGMQHEIDALERNDTWTLEDLPPGRKQSGANGFTR